MNEFGQTPKAVIELERVRGADSACKPVPYRLGAALRVLAASKPGSVVLHAGAGRAEVGAWLLHGLDIMSRLITIADDPEEAALSKTHVGNDLRVAVHRQELLSFFADVRENRFDIVVFDSTPEDLAIFDAALELLSPGGLFVCFDLAREDASYRDVVRQRLGRSKDYCVSELGEMLVASRRSASRPSRRGSARRDRQQRALRAPDS